MFSPEALDSLICLLFKEELNNALSSFCFSDMNNSSICSLDNPLVSGTKNHVNRIAAPKQTANTYPYLYPIFDVMVGVSNVIKKFVSQLQFVAIPMDNDLVLTGYSSETKTKVIGPNDMAKQIMNIQVKAIMHPPTDLDMAPLLSTKAKDPKDAYINIEMNPPMQPHKKMIFLPALETK